MHGQTYIKGTAYQVPNPPTDSALRGIGNQFTLHGDAAAGGAVFGLNIDVLSASADFSASSQQVNANVDVSVLGQSVFNINESDPNSWAQTNQISKGVDFHTTIPIPISIVTLSVTVGAQGQVGLQYSATMDSPMAFVSGSVGPYVQSNVYAQAGVGIGGSWLGVSAGVGGNMTLMNYNMDVEGEVGLLWFINTGLMEKLQVTDSLNLLSGNIYVFAQFNYPCVPDFWNSCSSQISHTLWSWPGFQTNGTLASYNNSHPL